MNIEKLRALWDGHAKAVYGYLLRLTKNEADAADFLQELFCRLGRQPELVEKLTCEPRGYLLRLAHNAVVDQVRRAQARERVFEKITVARAGEFAAAPDPDQEFLKRELLAALHELPEEQRVVVQARLWKMRTLDDIARELGISINTAASRYRYGIDKMRARLRSLYEDFAPAASPKPNLPMKKNSKNPFADSSAEQPIIRPLEQRRVPSATGAAFALPVLPDHPDDAPVDEVPVDDVSVDPAVEGKLVDPIFVTDDFPVDGEFVDGEFPVKFDDIIFYTMGAGDPVDGEIVDDGSVEEFNPDVIFYTLFPGEKDPATDGEVIDDGGEVVDGELGDPAIDDGVVIDKPVDDYPTDDTTDHSADGGVTPIEWVKRGGGVMDKGATDDTTTDGGEVNPEIYYMTGALGGVQAQAAGGVVDHAVDHPADAPAVDHATDSPAVDHATDTPATEHAPAAHTAHDTTPLAATTTAAADKSASASTFDLQPQELHAALTHDDAVQPAAMHFDGNLPAGLGAAHGDLAPEHELHMAEFTPAHVAFDAHDGAHDKAELSSVHDATHADATVDAWVPLHAESTDAPLVAHFDTTLSEPQADHDLSVVAADLATGHDAALHGSAIAMAATGAVLLTREAKSREEEERA